jgi:sucrose phosphorylase
VAGQQSEMVERLGRTVQPRLALVYQDRAAEAWQLIRQVCASAGPIPQRSAPLWTEKDVVLITYADQIRSTEGSPLAELDRFLAEHRLNDRFSILHLLPFFPSSSDDGFSVIDYRQVDPKFGNWSHIHRLGESYDLMFDLVLNHVSRRSRWFQAYLNNESPFDRYFVEVDPSAKLDLVVRPRSLPLLTRCATARGDRHVWTTFSDDQIDLNYAEPAVLAEMLSVFLDYLSRGARVIRLDAIAYLWKQLGTTCIHLPQTHALVKLFRDVVDALAPGTILLTETNVPHAENVGYFGAGDEAHLVYNFSLPPLLLDALLTGDGSYLQGWLSDFPQPAPGTSFLNFTASHDGIGVRPLESIVPAARIEQLADAVRARGGHVSTRDTAGGGTAPYELNTTYFDALGGSGDLADNTQADRFLASQAIMLSLRGIPAIYFQSLFGAKNDIEGVRHTGRARSINRRKYDRRELEQMLTGEPHCRRVWDFLGRMLAVRRDEPAFHPDAPQVILAADDPAVIMLARHRPDTDQGLLVAANLSGQFRPLSLGRREIQVVGEDLMGQFPANESGEAGLRPYQVAWLPVRWPVNGGRGSSRAPRVASRSSITRPAAPDDSPGR